MIRLKEGDVDLWLFNLAKPPEELPCFLSRKELLYFKSIQKPEVAKRFWKSRNLLRWLLSRYLGCAPKKIQFRIGAHGKPYVRFPSSKIQFNLSHSENTILYGFSLHPLGVDLEKLKSRPHLEKLAQRYFSTKLKERFVETSAPNRTQAFYEIWTLSEAYIKGLGKSVLSMKKLQGKIRPQWTIINLNLKRGFIAALAVNQRKPKIR
jgi:4'-phosphopantetheinyl transferase